MSGGTQQHHYLYNLTHALDSMTEVLSAPRDGASYFSSGSLHHSPPRRIPSLNTPNAYLQSRPIKPSFDHSEYSYETLDSTSAPSSAPSSPQLVHTTFSRRTSYTSTPASSLSLDIKGDAENEGEIDFPSYEKSGSLYQVEEVQEPAPKSGEDDGKPSATPVPEDEASQGNRRPKDDQAIEREPTRHVDYLAHEWKLEDIWSSWRYVVARRKVYSNSVRLENASWRTWAKAKDNLKTVSPESLNWYVAFVIRSLLYLSFLRLKDYDVTWLYGPLQTESKTSFSNTVSPPPSRLSTSSSFLHKKPILKKRSASEAILQRSISEHSLLKQVSAILKSQEGTPAASWPSFERAVSDFSIRTTPPESVANTPAGEESQHTFSREFSVTSSGLQSPGERRHIHFNNEVVQCIAVESKDDDEEEGEEEEQSPAVVSADEDEDEEDDLVMMKHVPSKARTSNRSTPRGSFSAESKTIAPLPSTTLKYRSDTPEPPEAQQQQTMNYFWTSGKKLSPSPSQETLRPTRPNANFLIDDDDEEYPDLQWQPSSSTYKSPPQEASLAYESEARSGDGYDPGPGMRRTPSGMFMPYDEDEDDAALEKTLFGRVVDTVNTAKDIAHVIWNVGWRR